MHAQLKRYLKAVTELLSSGADLKTVLKNTRAAMEKRGHERLYPALLRALIRVYPGVEKRNVTEVILAKESDAARFSKKNGEALITIDPTIIGGYIETKNFVREDHSYKTKLLTWYRRATNTK